MISGKNFVTRKSALFGSRRPGAFIVLVALMLVFLLGMIAFAVDVGFMMNVDTDLRRTADAGALAGAGGLVDGAAVAQANVMSIITQNRVAGQTLSASDVTIQVGKWNADTRTFTEGGTLPSAIRVVTRANNQPFFFGRVMGQQTFNMETEAIAVYQPRDIVIVLDYSGSMSDDSELMSIGGALTSTYIENLLNGMHAEIGSPSYGTLMNHSLDYYTGSVNQVKSRYGLSGVSWPFPSGSWTDYIEYVRKDDNNNLPSSYRYKYGRVTFFNYLQERRESYAQCPVLWKCSEQPITATKNAVQMFLAFLQEHDTDDRVGLAVYTSNDGTALLEEPLTKNYQEVEDTSRQRQAGHYQSYTNIGDGIKVGREELVENARVGASRLIILMTDGVANRPSGNPSQYAVTQAQACADAKIPIVAISLGAGADNAIMQQIADITGGVHFNVPGGQPVSAYEEDLKDVFRQVAEDRPLKLVQ